MCVCVCVCVRACVRACARACVNASVRAQPNPTIGRFNFSRVWRVLGKHVHARRRDTVPDFLFPMDTAHMSTGCAAQAA